MRVTRLAGLMGRVKVSGKVSNLGETSQISGDGDVAAQPSMRVCKSGTLWARDWMEVLPCVL